MSFKDRHEAGRRLAQALEPHIRHPAVVYGIARSGVAVAAEVALACHLPLEVVAARKVEDPLNGGRAVCAVTETGTSACDPRERLRLDPAWLVDQIAEAKVEAERWRSRYDAGRPRHHATGKCAVIVDDGIVTGLTLEVAIEEIRADRPSRIVVGVPVAPPGMRERFEGLCDSFVVLEVPKDFQESLAAYYEDARRLFDGDVQQELERVRRALPQPLIGFART